MQLKSKRIYLDHAAACPILPSVHDFVREFVMSYENPSAYYLEARTNYGEVERVREQIAKTLNCDPDEIIFTSGCSESNALAVDGFIKANNPFCEVHCSQIEHSSILNNPIVVPDIPVNEKGFVSAADIEIQDGDLVCVMHANNEVGTIQPIKKIANAVHKQGGYLLVDAAQTYGKLPIDVKELGIDMLSTSGGKFGALRGTGFLYVNKNCKIQPIIYGTQENELRGGTYFDLGIRSMGVAITRFDKKFATVCRSKRDWLIKELLSLDGVHLIGSQANRLPNNVFISLEGLDIGSQQLVGLLDDYGFCVSAGSACHAGEDQVSHVLKAMKVPEELTKSCLRITISHETDVNDLVDLITAIKTIIKIHRVEG